MLASGIQCGRPNGCSENSKAVLAVQRLLGILGSNACIRMSLVLLNVRDVHATRNRHAQLLALFSILFRPARLFMASALRLPILPLHYYTAVRDASPVLRLRYVTPSSIASLTIRLTKTLHHCYICNIILPVDSRNMGTSRVKVCKLA